MPKVSLAKWIRFSIAALVYFLWVLWVGNYWLFLGLPVIFDIYITKKVPWNFWKKTKNGEKPKAWVEWVDALLFALVAVYFINLFLFQNYKIPTSSLEKSLLVGDHLFVSKVTYGPRIPNTPLSFPLLQNTVPILNTKSYSEWPQWKYKRLKGFKEVEKGDIVVFNFPTGDTVTSNFPNLNPDFYITCRREGINKANANPSLLQGFKDKSQWEINSKLRQLGKDNIKQNNENWGDLIYRPVDRRDNYVKRCVAVAGDTFEIKSNQIYINGVKVHNPKGLQHFYNIITDGTKFNKRFLDKLEISNEDTRYLGEAPNYTLPLTKDKADELKEYPFIRQISMDEQVPDSNYILTWPHSSDYNWSRDNFGPLWIPQKGTTVQLTLKNLVLYDRIITAYEGNTLDVKNGEIYINGKKQNEYTFNMDYYFMLGDNRHQSQDSRYWGFVPEDHVVGRPLLVWLSLNKDKSLFEGKIRFERFFKWVANEQ
ncbi:signal peptidase I [Plebeiibacterium sediminum]|uniref:Signal peptidase I n=1 Tax=Plebeiibacterium sediminum TaxID=2992112 RepID=A0AAE3M225_9BACT|nr:signal peptidase I [Plebeiobacterium sediminum]MCW3785699.1 signal peptidase I [Plebeiobacterium sediminum]